MANIEWGRMFRYLLGAALSLVIVLAMRKGLEWYSAVIGFGLAFLVVYARKSWMAVLFLLSMTALFAVGGTVLVAEGVRFWDYPAACDGRWMSAGDMCSVVVPSRSSHRYESWTPAGTRPVPPKVPTRLQFAPVRVLDAAGKQAMQRTNCKWEIGSGVLFLLLSPLAVRSLFRLVRELRASGRADTTV
jgi:hypothetical protein